MARWGLFVLMAVGLTGCATNSNPNLPPADFLPEAKPTVFLDTPEIQQARLQDFIQKYSHVTEQTKIQYLLQSMKDSQAIFVRNGTQHDGRTAAGWLRWKMTLSRYREDPLRDAHDFIARVCVRSEQTGIRYQIQFQNGDVQDLAPILEHELLALEEALKEHLMATALSPETVPMQTQQAQDTTVLPVPVILASAST